MTTKPSPSQVDEIGCPSVRTLCCIGMAAEPEEGGGVPPQAAAEKDAGADPSPPPAKEEEPSATAGADQANVGEGNAKQAESSSSGALPEGLSLNYEVPNL